MLKFMDGHGFTNLPHVHVHINCVIVNASHHWHPDQRQHHDLPRCCWRCGPDTVQSRRRAVHDPHQFNLRATIRAGAILPCNVCLAWRDRRAAGEQEDSKKFHFNASSMRVPSSRPVSRSTWPYVSRSRFLSVSMRLLASSRSFLRSTPTSTRGLTHSSNNAFCSGVILSPPSPS